MKKAIIIVVVLVLVAVGVLVYWIISNPKPEPSPVQIAGPETEREEAIKNKVAESNVGLKHLRIAVWSYFVDHNSIPDTASQLCAPVAYLSRIPADPFTEGSELNYTKLGKKEFLIWGIGPDGINDNGQIIYDPSNGISSRGDIIQTNDTQ
jgi:hypothetical protein